MNQATFLISRYLIKDYPHLKYLKGNKLRDKLHSLLKDPELWKKIRTLKSAKYTKQYQAPKQLLKRVDFYAFAEDWCFLSILSNSTGFSRCYIFIHLLRYDIGDLKLESENNGTPQIKMRINDSKKFSCTIILNKSLRFYHRIPKTEPHHPETPENTPIPI